MSPKWGLTFTTERAGGGFRRLAEQLRQDFLRRAGQGDLATVQRHQVAAGGQQYRAVGDDDDRPILAEVGQRLAQFLLRMAIEAA